MSTVTTLSVTATEVRTWARARKMQVTDHGRLSRSVVAAYNKSHKRQYTPTFQQPRELLSIPGRRPDKNGVVKPYVYKATAGQVREWAQSNGFPELGDRGRIPAAVFTAFGVREIKPVKARKSRKAAKAA